MSEREGLNLRNLVISVILSLVVWGYLLGIEFACVLIFSIMVHEYGHYWWMAKEGIKKRDMIMIPPLGAIATAKEYWPSYGAEARISLAGPYLGLLPAIIFGNIAVATNSTFWIASAGIAAVINIFNLIPAIPLDGGRVFRAVLVSISPKLRFLSRILSAGVITLLFFNGFLILSVFMLYMFYREESRYMSAERLLKITEDLRSSGYSEEQVGMTIDLPTVKHAEMICNLPRMNFKEYSMVIISNAIIICCHLYIYAWAMSTLGIENFFDLYKFLL